MKLNLGCGDKYLEGYTNVDYSPITNNNQTTNCDVFHNLKLGLPFDDNVADEILLHQVLEHFNRHDAIPLLQEIFRVLKKDGVFICSVPPAERQMKKYLVSMRNIKNIEDFLYAHEKWTSIKFHDDLAGGTVRTVVDGNDIGDFMSHKTFYSKNMLNILLKHIGFKVLEIDEEIHARCTK